MEMKNEITPKTKYTDTKIKRLRTKRKVKNAIAKASRKKNRV